MIVGHNPTWLDFEQILERNPSFLEARSRKDVAEYEVNHIADHDEDCTTKASCSIEAS